LNVWVRDLAVYDDGTGEALYAGGSFTNAGGVTVNNIAKWDGTVWSALSGPSGTGMDGIVYSLGVYDDGSGGMLYAGGYFTTAGGVTVNRIATWDGSEWSTISGTAGAGMNDYVSTLAVYDDGTGEALYARGRFTNAGGVTVNSVAKWDGRVWSALGGPSGSVLAMAVYDDGTGEALYVGGWYYIAKWDGTAWYWDTSIDDLVYALTVYDDGTGEALYAAGFFTTAGGVTVNSIGKWDGTAWSALSGPSGTGMNGFGLALAVYDDGTGEALYVGGNFTNAGGVTVNDIAKWDGSAWSALSGPSGTGVNNDVQALAVFDDGTGERLYAAGAFTTAGGVTVNRFAQWDGAAWSALSGSSGADMYGVNVLAVYDDGNGEALYAGGAFIMADGVTVNNIAKWDGTVWSALSGPSGTGMGGSYPYDVYSLAVYDDGTGKALYAGGEFETAGGVASNYIAQWKCNFQIFVDGFESGDLSGWSSPQP
jgi:hypothetical protein